MRRLYICLNCIFIVLISMSMAVSTFHTHHNIQWNSPQKFADTGHYIANDAAQCPICGYLFNANPIQGISFKQIMVESFLVPVTGPFTFLPSSFSSILGRAPPASS